MKQRLFLLLLLILHTFIARCQKTPEDYFNEGHQAELKNLNAEALADFLYVVDQHPNNIYAAAASFRVGHLYTMLGNNERAIKAFRFAVFAKEYPIMIKDDVYRDPDYRRNAANELSAIYEQMEDYDSALYYINMYDTIPSHISGCYYAVSSAKNTITMKYAAVYIAANRIHDAEHLLLSRKYFATFNSKDPMATKLNELFKKYEQPDVLRSKMETAVNNYFFDTIYYNKRADTNVYCCINFLGATIRYYYRGDVFPNYDFTNIAEKIDLSEREKILAWLKRSDLYVIVQSL